MFESIMLEFLIVVFTIVIYFIVTFIISLFKKEFMFHIEYVITMFVSALLFYDIVLTAHPVFVLVYFISPISMFFAGSIVAGFMLMERKK